MQTCIRGGVAYTYLYLAQLGDFYDLLGAKRLSLCTLIT